MRSDEALQSGSVGSDGRFARKSAKANHRHTLGREHTQLDLRIIGLRQAIQRGTLRHDEADDPIAVAASLNDRCGHGDFLACGRLLGDRSGHRDALLAGVSTEDIAGK
ncbi:MAG: hypothetical protein RL299_289 [Pseudomonadota bacterium]